MKILHVSCITDNPANGMSVVIPELVKEEGKREDVILINLTDFRPQVKEKALVFNIHDLKKIGFRRIERKYGEADIVIFHGIYLPRIWKFYFFYIKGKKPYIILPHGSMSIEVQKKGYLKKLVFNNLVVYKFTRNAKAIQFLSENEKSLSNPAFYKRYFVIGNGILQKKGLYHKKQHVNLDILYIGRMDIHNKGLDLLLQAIEKKRDFLIKKHIKISLYGPDIGQSKKKIQDYIDRYELSGIVVMGDGVFGIEKEKLLLNCDYFIQTSRTEGMPMGVLEALSYGIPVLITRGTGFKREVELYKCGFTAENTVNSIEELFYLSEKNKDYISEMSRNALKCAENYSWDMIVKKTLIQYRQCIRGSE